MSALDRFGAYAPSAAPTCPSRSLCVTPRQVSWHTFAGAGGESLRATDSLIPVVMVTTEGKPQLMRKATSLGAKGWVIEPSKPELLVAAVHERFARRGRARVGATRVADALSHIRCSTCTRLTPGTASTASISFATPSVSRILTSNVTTTRFFPSSRRRS